MKNIRIKSAKYISEYKIKFVFTDDSVKTIDFCSFILNHKSPHVTPYKNKRKFSNFKINENNISWDDYNMSFGADYLYKGNVSDTVPVKFILKSFSKKKAKALIAQ